MKTRKARLQRAISALRVYCRRQRHRSRMEQHAALVRRLTGHYRYFGVNGNIRSQQCLLLEAKREWFRWLRRRSQRGKRLTWKRFNAYLDAYPLPQPRIYVSIWAKAS